MGREDQKLKLGMFSPAWPSLDTSLHVPYSPEENGPMARATNTSLPVASPKLVNCISSPKKQDRRKEGNGHSEDGIKLHAEEFHRFFGRPLCPTESRLFPFLYRSFNYLPSPLRPIFYI